LVLQFFACIFEDQNTKLMIIDIIVSYFKKKAKK